MLRFAQTILLPSLLSACLLSCGGGAPAAGFGGDLGGDLSEVAAELPGAADLRDALDDHKSQDDLLPPDIGAPDLTDLAGLPDGGDLLDAAPDLGDALAPLDALADTAPDTLQSCGGPCGPYQLCDQASDQCVTNPACLDSFCAGETEGMAPVTVGQRTVFVDLLEWPGLAGQLPLGGVDFATASGLCAGAGKRLCSSEELTAACGVAGKYPYGSAYQGLACNTEPPFKLAPCGSFEACHAPALAVLDLVGNAAEWTFEGTLFGGSCRDGALARCQALPVPEGGLPYPELVGLRCCTAPDDDLDGDGVPASRDCEEGDPTVHDGAPETCDGRDEDCDLLVDDVEDLDGDGFDACQDCNDTLAAINPGADDEAGDGLDLDCDGVDGQDHDGDGHLSVASGGDDCDDSTAAVHPGHAELCDGLDNDCDGAVDAPLAPGDCNEGLCPTPLIECDQGFEVIPQTMLKLHGENSFAESGTISRWLWEVDQPQGSQSVFLPTNSFPSPEFEVNVAGKYNFYLTVWDEQNVESCIKDQYEVTVIPDEAIHIELLWTTPGDPDETDEGDKAGSDLDLHFAHPFATMTDVDGDGKPDPWFDQPYDCFWFNDQPNWGSWDPNVDDDPGLDRDDTDGAGPENVNLNIPENNTVYTVGVHYWNNHGYGDAKATVRVYIYSQLVFEISDVLLSELDMWEVATVAWPSGKVQSVVNNTGQYKITGNYQGPFMND